MPPARHNHISARRNKVWRTSSVILNLCAVLMIVLECGPALVQQYYKPQMTIVDIGRNQSIQIFEPTTEYSATCADSEDEVDIKACGAKEVTVKFNNTILCNTFMGEEITGTASDSSKVPEWFATLGGYLAFLAYTAHPIVKMILLQVGVFEPCSEMRMVAYELIGFFNGLGLMMPLFFQTPCYDNALNCDVEKFKETLTSPRCITVAKGQKGSTWVITLVLTLFIIILLGLLEIPWLKNSMAKRQLMGFTEGNIRKNRALKGVVIAYGILGIINLASVIQAPASTFLIYLSVAMILCIADDFIQFALVGGRCYKKKGKRTIRFGLEARSVSSSVLADQLNISHFQPKQEIAADLPERLVMMMGDENKVTRALLSSHYIADNDTLNEEMNKGFHSSISNSQFVIGDQEYKIHTFRVNTSNMFVLGNDPLSTTMSKHGGESETDGFMKTFNNEPCIACCERSRSIAMNPCNHLVYCSECMSQSMLVKRQSREVEQHRISKQIQARHVFIRNAFRKVQQDALTLDDIAPLIEDEAYTFPVPNVQAFKVFCPLCRGAVNQIIYCDMMKAAAKRRLKGRSICEINYSLFKQLFDAFNQQAIDSRKLVTELLNQDGSQESLSVLTSLHDDLSTDHDLSTIMSNDPSASHQHMASLLPESSAKPESPHIELMFDSSSYYDSDTSEGIRLT